MSAELVPIAEDCIRLVVFYNPLDLADRESAELEWTPGKLLSQYLEGLPEDIEWNIRLNDHDVSARETWVEHEPKPGDIIVVAPVPQDDFLPVLAIVATLAIAVAAGPIGTAFAAGSFGTSFAAATGLSAASVAAIGSAAFSVAGGLLISAIMPRPSLPSRDTQADSPSYGVDGPKNSASEGLPVPVVYGKRRVAGNIVNLYNENDTDADGLSIQRLYVQSVVSEGKIKSLTNFEVNGQPLANFDDIAIRTALGTPNQGKSPWFADTINLYNLGSEVDTDFDTYVTLDEVDSIRLDFVAPQGVVRFDNDGDRKGTEIGLTIEIRRFGTSNAWISFSNEIAASAFKITGKTRSAVRASFISRDLARARYEIRWRRNAPVSNDVQKLDALNISDVGEIIESSAALINSAWIAARVGITGEFTSLPTITALCEGRELPIYDARGAVTQTAWSDNPADVAIDVLTNTRYGGSEPLTRIDFAKFAEWRAFCVENDLHINIIFDSESDVEESLREVFRAGRAHMIRAGARISVSIDRAEDPVMVFGDGNIETDSFELNYLSFQDRVNEIEVSFFDEEDNYRQRFVKVVDEDAVTRGDPQKPARYVHYGETSADRAGRDALFQLEANKRIVRTARWRSPVEAVTCLPGDVVLTQNGMPSWSEGGRVEAGSTAAVVKIDKPLQDWGASPERRLIVVHDTVQRATATVSGQTGDVVFLTGLNPASFGRVRRATFSGAGSFDVAVLDVASSGSPRQVLLEARAASLSLVGRTVTLWDTDVIEERSCSAYNPATNQITVNSPFSKVPETYAKWMFGRVGITGKPFRVQAIGVDGEGVCEVRAIEYRGELYGDLENIPPPLSYAVTPFISHVQNLALTQEVDRTLNVLRNMAVVRWDVPQSGDYAGAVVEKRVNGGDWERVQNAQGRIRTVEFEAKQGDLVFVRVRAYDSAGNFAPIATAPQAFIEMARTTRTLAAPNNFQAIPGFLSVTITVDAHPEPEVFWQVFRGTNPASPPATPFREFVGTTLTITPLESNQTYNYWIRARHPDTRVSSLAGPIQATSTLIQAIDIEAEILDTTKFASGLEPVAITYLGESLPNPVGYTGPSNRFNANDGKLYRYLPGPPSIWSAAVEAPDITGQIEQQQIADQAISAAKLALQAVTADRLASNAVTRDKILAGAVDAVRLANEAATAAKIAPNAVTAGKIAAGAVTAEKIAANAVQASSIAAGAVTADKISANSVTADKIAANSITASKIAANSVTADKIAANSITGDKIVSRSISTSSLVVADLTNLVKNPELTPAPGQSSGADGWIIDVVNGSVGIIGAGPEWGAPRIFSANNSTFAVYSSPFPVIPGQTIAWSVIYGVSAGSLGIDVITSEDENLTIGVGTIPGFGTGVASGRTDFSGVVPANARFARLRVFSLAPNTTAVFGGAWARVAAQGKLIVDGAVTADKLAANSVVAGKIQAGAIRATEIAVDSITGDRLAFRSIAADRLRANSITSLEVAANSISADRLNVSSLDAISANLGTIQVGSANIANLAVTSLKIGNEAVLTDKIRNGDISDTSWFSDDNPGATAPSDQWTPIGSVVVDRTYNNPVLLQYSASVSNPNAGNSTCRLRVVENGNLVVNSTVAETIPPGGIRVLQGFALDTARANVGNVTFTLEFFTSALNQSVGRRVLITGLIKR